jgi:hypothetical protein
VEDGDGQTLLHIEPMTLFFSHKGAASATTHVSCTVPLVTPLPQYFLRVMADRWLHAHQVIPMVCCGRCYTQNRRCWQLRRWLVPALATRRSGDVSSRLARASPAT